MSHSVNPVVFRIKKTKDWDSKGFYEKNFPAYLEEDYIIRSLLEKKGPSLGIARIKIERSLNKVNVIISSMRPGLIIGRGGEGIKKLKAELVKAVAKTPFRKKDDKKDFQLRVEIREVRDSWSTASLVVEWVADQIQKRTHYRRVLKKTLEKIMMQKGIKGARVQVAGRLNGISIARTEWLREGLLPRQTIRANIEYARGEAHCSYGVIGIKVWIYKEDVKLEDKEK